MNWSKLKSKTTLLKLLAAAILVLAAVLVVPALINFDTYAHQLADGLTEALGSRVVIESGRLAILPDVSFVVSGVEIPDGVGPIKQVYVPRARIDLDVFSLLLGKILVEEVHIHSPRARLSLRGQSDEPSAASSMENPLSFLRESDMLPEQMDVSIRNGYITLNREAASFATVETELCDVDIEVKGMSPDRPFDVSASCSVPCDGDAGEVEAEFQIDTSAIGSVERILPFKLSGAVSAQRIACSSFETYLPPKMRDAGFSGRCSLNVAVETQDPKQVSLQGEASIERLSLRNSLSGQGLTRAHGVAVSFQSAVDRVGFTGRSFFVTVDEDKLGGRLSVGKPGASEAVIACELGAYKLPVSTILDLLPGQLLPPDALERIRNMDISGELRALMIGFAGRASDLYDSTSLVPKSLIGFCSVNRMKASEVLGTLGVEGFSGRASLGEGVISLDIERGFITSPSSERPIKMARFVSVNAGFLNDLKKKAADFSWARLTKNYDPSRASDAMVVVRVPILDLPVADAHRIFAAMSLPASGEQMLAELDQLDGNISGHCDIAVFVAEPYEPSVDVKFHVPGGRFRYKPLDIRVRPISVEANISPQFARLDTLMAFDGPSPLTCTVEINEPYSDSASLSAKATYQYRQDSFAAPPGEFGPETFAIDGPDPVVEATVTGDYRELAIAIESDLTGQEIAYGEWFRKQADEHCRLSLSAKTSGFEEVLIDEAQIEIGGVVVRGSGKIASPGAPQWEMSVYLNETDVSELARFCPKVSNLDLKARLSGSLMLLPQDEEPGGVAPDGSTGTPTLCRARLVATLDADAINKVLAADVISESLGRALHQTDFTSGQAKAQATIEFPLWDVDEAKFEAAAELQDLGLKHSDLPLELSGLSGKVELGNHALHIRSLTGALGQSSFELEAEVAEPLLAASQEASWKAAAVNLRLLLRPSLADVKTALGASFPESLFYSEAPEVELKAEGSPEDLALQVLISPRGDALAWDDIRLNPERADLTALLVGRLEELTRLSTARGDVDIGTSKLKLEGEASDLTKPELRFRIAQSPVRMADISALLSILDPSLASGELILSMEGELDPQLPTGRRVQARLIARGVSFGLIGAERRVENLNFSLDASPSVINVEGFSVKVGQSKASLYARADFDANDLRLDIKSSNLDTDDFVKALSSKETSETQSSATASPAMAAPLGDLTWLGQLPFFAHGTVDASVNLERLIVGKHDLGRIDLALPIKDGILRVDGFQTDFCHGDLSLNLAARRLLSCGLSLETDFKLRDVKLEELLQLAGTEKVLATGRARISGSLDACGSDTDELLNFATGQFKLKSRDGVIKKFGILSKIFTLLDILRVFKMDFKDFRTTGTSYELLECTAKLGDGVLSTRDFVLTGSSMKMTAICDVDLMSQTVDATVGVFLMPTMGSLTNKIPFVGPLITQGNKTLLPTYFRVRGDVSDPKVESLQLNLIKASTIDVLRKLLSVSDSARP